MHGGYPQGVPFHGEFSSADAHAPGSEAAARMSLYGVLGAAGAFTPLTLKSTDQVIIHSLSIVCGATGLIVTLFDGADANVDAGETVMKGTYPANGGETLNMASAPHYCQPGTYPKILTSVAGQIDVIVHGTIYGLPGV